MFRRSRILPLLLLAVLIAGCSALRIGYRHADTYFSWRVDEYFDLNSQQKQDFNERLKRQLAWHRYEQLPEYAVFVETAVKKGQAGLAREDIMWFVSGIQSRYRIIINHGIDDAVDLLMPLSPAQIIALQKQWDKDNRKFAKDRALDGPVAERKFEREKRVKDEISDWTGRLTDEQEEKIVALFQAVPFINHLRYQDRIRRQKEFLELLKLRTNRQVFHEKLHAWLLDWDHGRSPEFVQLSAEVYAKRIQFYLAVEKVLTPEQRQTAWQRLQNFADDFKSLSKKSVNAGAAPTLADKLALLCLPALDACLPE